MSNMIRPACSDVLIPISRKLAVRLVVLHVLRKSVKNVMASCSRNRVPSNRTLHSYYKGKIPAFRAMLFLTKSILF